MVLLSSSSVKNSFKKREGKRLPSPFALLLSSLAPVALLLSSSCDGDGKKSVVEVSASGREGGRWVGWWKGVGGVGMSSQKKKFGSRMAGPKKKKNGPGKNESKGKRKRKTRKLLTK
jgi:hypothetical protein